MKKLYALQDENLEGDMIFRLALNEKDAKRIAGLDYPNIKWCVCLADELVY